MKYTVIYTPTIDYHYMQQRPQRIMEQFARHGHQVYYMNQHQQPGRPMEMVEPNLYVVYDQNEIFAAPKHHKVVLWITWAQTHPWVEILQPDITVYDCLDDFAEWRPYEDAVTAKADLVVTTADFLYQKMSYKHTNVIMAKNGCEFEHFQNPHNHVKPFDWPLAPGIRSVGYIGAMATWVDHELVTKIAQKWPVVMIGLEYGLAYSPGTHRMGLRDYKLLPGYIQNMDALIIPFSTTNPDGSPNEIIRSTNPIKMYEYLATGKPVITTAMPEAQLHPEVTSCNTHEEFIAAVDRAMIGLSSSPVEVERRQALAKENSWRARYDTIMEALDNTAKIKSLSDQERAAI